MGRPVVLGLFDPCKISVYKKKCVWEAAILPMIHACHICVMLGSWTLNDDDVDDEDDEEDDDNDV